MTVIQRRLMKEFQTATENAPQIQKLAPKGNDVLQLEAKILGPENSPYSDYIFTLDITIPTDFPFKPPKIRFAQPVYHPSVKDDGNICLDALGEKWTPNLSIVTILLQIIELLADPSTENPVMPDIAQQIQRSPKEFFDAARQHTKLHAEPNDLF